MHLRAGASVATVIYFGNRIADAMAKRLQAIATPLVTNMDKVQIIPPPKGVDPRVLVWKGAAVLGKMDGVSDLWLTATEWVSRKHSPMQACFVHWRLLIRVGPLGDTGPSRTLLLLVTPIQLVNLAPKQYNSLIVLFLL
jgi:hypothetical protein